MRLSSYVATPVACTANARFAASHTYIVPSSSTNDFSLHEPGQAAACAQSADTDCCRWGQGLVRAVVGSRRQPEGEKGRDILRSGRSLGLRHDSGRSLHAAPPRGIIVRPRGPHLRCERRQLVRRRPVRCRLFVATAAHEPPRRQPRVGRHPRRTRRGGPCRNAVRRTHPGQRRRRSAARQSVRAASSWTRRPPIAACRR